MIRIKTVVWALRLISTALLSACSESGSGGYVLISDSTMGSGRPIADPEDGFAILTAVLNPERRPVAIISTFGNTDEDIAYASVLSVLEGAGKRVTVLRGASGPEDRESDRPIEGAEWLIAESRRHPGQVDVVSIGALTTLAAAVRGDPSFALNVGRVTIMGGAVFVPGNVPLDFKAEFNLAFDARSAAEVVSALPEKITLVPLDATNDIVFGPDEMERLRVGQRPLHHFILESVATWYDLNVPLFGGFYLFDAAAVAAYLRPEVITKEESVALTVDASGATVAGAEGRSVKVVLKLDSSAVKQYVMNSLGL